jgi:hypothetical protein
LIFSLNFSAYSDEDDDDERGCNVGGHETFNAVVLLAPTTNAPAGARGVAKLEAEQDDGEVEAELELKLIGLSPGDYLLSVTRQSDGTNIVLGKLTIGKPRCDDEDDDDEDDDDDWRHRWHWLWHWGHDHHWIRFNWGGFTNWGSWTNWSITNWCNASNRATAVEAEVELPDDLDPTDIAKIILSDTNGVPLLVGDLVKPAASSVINITASGRVLPGTAAPAVTGVAQVQSTAVRGRWRHQFRLEASGFDAKTILRVYVNEKKGGGTRSSRFGTVTMKKLPGRTSAVRSVELMTPTGQVAARARF